MNFIWDLDGTLIDSYPVILQSLEEIFNLFEIPCQYNEIRAFILDKSVVSLLKQTSTDFNIPYEELKFDFSIRTRSKNDQVILMDHVIKFLDWTKREGIENYIYTHKSDNALSILSSLKIAEYFSEVITSSNGFRRKPDAEAIDYLITKYKLLKEETYYIGDRIVDVNVAINAGIKSINLTQPSSSYNVNISGLTDILNLKLT
ncbi:HAD-IA family hydrolase [Marinilactibacillus kalidii]|uniref:HAD-IA family hydrolase n=1 Tax=Marinilactibacillus kalidii TaxID=2820274 RepID=UPI001FC9843E|nr:HAD-IA family hydrolase [Marinilactibacillus kalidii]